MFRNTKSRQHSILCIHEASPLVCFMERRLNEIYDRAAGHVALVLADYYKMKRLKQ